MKIKTKEKSTRGITMKFNVDSFTTCYRANKDVINLLSGIEKDKDGFKFPFKLYRIKEPYGIYDNLIKVTVNNPLNTKQYIYFGDLYYSEKRIDDYGNTYVWFRIENEVFYTQNKEKGVNILPFMLSITNELNLIFNNITTLDIACDSNVNFSKKIKKAVCTKNLLPVINNIPRYNEDELIPELRFMYGCNQKTVKNMTMYLKQDIDSVFELKGYDKDKEIEVRKKQYISNWLKIKKPFRTEIHLKNEQIKPFLEKKNNT